MTEASTMNLADELAKLESLRQTGALTENEFARAKARVLGDAGAAPARDRYHDREEMPGGFLHRLERSRKDAWVGGVCGGLGRATDIPSWGWRLMFTLGIFCAGFGLLPYILMWIFIPEEPGAE